MSLICGRVLFRFYNDWQITVTPSNERCIAFFLICSRILDGCKRHDFFMSDFAVLSFPTFFQRVLLDDLDAVMLSHFDNLASCFVIRSDVFRNLFCSMPLVWMVVTFIDHPAGLNNNNESLFSIYGAGTLHGEKVIQQGRESQGLQAHRLRVQSKCTYS